MNTTSSRSGLYWHLQLLQLLFRYIEAGGIPSILFHYIPLLFSATICWYPLPFWLLFYFMCARGASSRSGQRKEGIELTTFGGTSLWAPGSAGVHPGDVPNFFVSLSSFAKFKLNATLNDFGQPFQSDMKSFIAKIATYSNPNPVWLNWVHATGYRKSRRQLL